MNGIVKIESEVPFGRTLYTSLYLKDLHLNNLVRHDLRETHYLAWETVRKETNPFFVKGTGFEGYLVGRCTNPEEALEAILGIAQNTLDAIARLYRFELGIHTRLMHTLTRESSDPVSIHIWSSHLGAQLAMLRAQILCNAQEAQKFQKRTYASVINLPPITYHEIKWDVTQIYQIRTENNMNTNRFLVTLHMLKPSQQDAWMVAENIGAFGHPLVRTLLDHV